MKPKRWAGMLLLVWLLFSCSYRKIMINDVVDMAEFALNRFENEYYDLKLMEQAAPANLVNLEALLANDPANQRMLVFLAKAYFSYTYAIEEVRWESILIADAADRDAEEHPAELKNQVSLHYRKGMDYALKALAIQHPDCEASLGNVRTALDFIKSLTIEDVPALFWYGMNLSAYINLNQDSVKAVSQLHLATKAMERVLELDPSYYYGCAHLALMTIYSSMPPMLGGNPERSLHHYREQQKIAGEDFLLLDLHYARYYLYQKQDREEYVHVLNHILERSKKHSERYVLFNQIAALRAAVYLKATDGLFN
ncbi:MAG: TRAP transporter TatT component family protein [Thermodesulfobacteriota bacterium]